MGYEHLTNEEKRVLKLFNSQDLLDSGLISNISKKDSFNSIGCVSGILISIFGGGTLLIGTFF